MKTLFRIMLATLLFFVSNIGYSNTATHENVAKHYEQSDYQVEFDMNIELELKCLEVEAINRSGPNNKFEIIFSTKEYNFTDYFYFSCLYQNNDDIILVLANQNSLRSCLFGYKIKYKYYNKIFNEHRGKSVFG